MPVGEKKCSNAMDNQWKYVAPVQQEILDRIEIHFKTRLPDDYKTLLPSCNQGKPMKSRFRPIDRNERVLSYLCDLNDVIPTYVRINVQNFIPFGLDPFGDFIGFTLNSSGDICGISFWEHETNSVTAVCKSFGDFLKMLY